MLTTIASSVSIGDNLVRSQATTLTDPTLSQGTPYYPAVIGKVTSIDHIVNNYQLFSYPMTAFGLRDTTGADDLVTTLRGAISDSGRCADAMSDPRFQAFATAFGLNGQCVAEVIAVTAATTGARDTSRQRQAEDDRASLIKVFNGLYTSQEAPLAHDDLRFARQPNTFKLHLDSKPSPQACFPADIDVSPNMIQTLPTPKNLRDPNKKVERLRERLMAFRHPSNPPAGPSVASIAGSSDTPRCSDLLIQSLGIGGV